MFLRLSKSFFIKGTEAHDFNTGGFPKLNPWGWSEDAVTYVHIIYPAKPNFLKRQMQSKWEN